MSDGELRQTMQRLMSIHDEIDEKKLDLKAVYADAKSAGFDKAALGLAIREIRGRDKAEAPAAQERAAIVELYVSAFDNAPRTYVHVPAREEPNEPMPRRDARQPVTQEGNHVDRSASAQPDSAECEPAIPFKAGDAGTGQAVCDEAALAARAQPSGAGTGSAVRAGAPEFAEPDATPAGAVVAETSGVTGGESAAAIRGLAEANAIAARSVQPTSRPSRDLSGDMPEIPAFLRRSREPQPERYDQ